MFELGYEVSCPSCLGKGEKVFNLLALVDTFLPVKYQQHPQSFGSLLAELTACSSRLSWSFFLATPSGVYSPKPPLLPLWNMKVVSAAELYLSLRLSLDLELDIRILSMDPASAPAVY
jgi:hypothetical protein